LSLYQFIMTPFECKELSTITEMEANFEMIKHLYASMTFDTYQSTLAKMQPHNYKQLAVYEGTRCVGLSGFWIGYKLWSGKYLEMDHVVVHPEYRSSGVGKIMTSYLTEIAKKEGCAMMALDTYTHNFGAQKFFFNQGFVPKGFHFVKMLEY
jgi:ribosomal protein S18 acetylase RimI-like enzyme